MIRNLPIRTWSIILIDTLIETEFSIYLLFMFRQFPIRRYKYTLSCQHHLIVRSGIGAKDLEYFCRTMGFRKAFENHKTKGSSSLQTVII